MRTNVIPIFCLIYVTGTLLFFVIGFFSRLIDSFVSVVDCGCSVKGSSRRVCVRHSWNMWYIFHKARHVFGVSSHLQLCLKPVEDDVHFYKYILYIYKSIYVFITFLEAHL